MDVDEEVLDTQRRKVNSAIYTPQAQISDQPPFIPTDQSNEPTETTDPGSSIDLIKTGDRIYKGLKNVEINKGKDVSEFFDEHGGPITAFDNDLGYSIMREMGLDVTPENVLDKFLFYVNNLLSNDLLAAIDSLQVFKNVKLADGYITIHQDVYQSDGSRFQNSIKTLQIELANALNKGQNSISFKDFTVYKKSIHESLESFKNSVSSMLAVREPVKAIESNSVEVNTKINSKIEELTAQNETLKSMISDSETKRDDIERELINEQAKQSSFLSVLQQRFAKTSSQTDQDLLRANKIVEGLDQMLASKNQEIDNLRARTLELDREIAKNRYLVKHLNDSNIKLTKINNENSHLLEDLQSIQLQFSEIEKLVHKTITEIIGSTSISDYELKHESIEVLLKKLPKRLKVNIEDVEKITKKYYPQFPDQVTKLYKSFFTSGLKNFDQFLELTFSIIEMMKENQQKYIDEFERMGPFFSRMQKEKEDLLKLLAEKEKALNRREFYDYMRS